MKPPASWNASKRWHRSSSISWTGSRSRPCAIKRGGCSSCRGIIGYLLSLRLRLQPAGVPLGHGSAHLVRVALRFGRVARDSPACDEDRGGEDSGRKQGTYRLSPGEGPVEPRVRNVRDRLSPIGGMVSWPGPSWSGEDKGRRDTGRAPPAHRGSPSRRIAPQQLVDEARALGDGGSEPDQVAEQLDPGRVDERHAGEVQAEAARRGVQLLADATQLVDPGAKELALELERGGRVARVVVDSRDLQHIRLPCEQSDLDDEHAVRELHAGCQAAAPENRFVVDPDEETT